MARNASIENSTTRMERTRNLKPGKAIVAGDVFILFSDGADSEALAVELQPDLGADGEPLLFRSRQDEESPGSLDVIVDVIAQISDLLDLDGYLINRDFGAWQDLNVFRPREKPYLFAAAKRTALFTVEENPRAARTEIDPAAGMVFRDHALEAYRPPKNSATNGVAGC